MEPDMENELEELSALLDCEDSKHAICTLESTSPVQSEKCDGTGPKRSKYLQECDIFGKEQEPSDQQPKSQPSLSQLFGKSTNLNKYESSEIHAGDTDSSDDEDNKYTAEQKYNENGRDIKNLMKKQNALTNTYTHRSTWKSNQPLFAPSEINSPLSGAKISKDVYMDPYFGIRIITPLISSQVLKDKMQGRMPVRFSRLPNHLANLDKSKDWVIGGAITSKFIKTSQKGNPYVCWTLSDLREGLQTVSVFLFGQAYKNLWKTNTHIVAAILNPTPLENRKSSNDVAALSVLNSDQVMILGQSKDLGTCKARKKNGEPCTAIVNMTDCDYCVYHVKQEYRKFNARSELQAPSGGGLSQLRNKVIGKNEIFYAGRSYTATVGKPTRKQVVKDQKRLSQLFNQGGGHFEPQVAKQATVQAQSARVQLMRDAERLQKLTGSPATLNSLADKRDDRTPTSKSSTIKGNSTPSSTKKCSEPGSIQKSNLEKTTDLESTGSKVKRKTDVKKTPCPQKLNTVQVKPGSNGKSNQPTKNRFENLTKLKSNHSKTNECELPSKTNKLPQSLDISFEFDDEIKTSSTKLQLGKGTSSKNFQKTHASPTSRLAKGTPEPKCHIPKTSDDKTELSEKKSLTSPLAENKLQRHNTSIDNHCQRLSNGNPNKPEQSKAESFSEDVASEFPVTRLKDLVHTNSPRLGEFGKLCVSVPSRQSAAKLKALRYVQRKGPIVKEEEKDSKRKREIKEFSKENKRKRTDDEEDSKNLKSSLSTRFIELMNATSKHTDLIANAENEALEDYYDKMEKKEKMEEKMLNTYKIECKAVRCLVCKYKWFSASEKCKAEKHPIKVISAIKRFFRCGNCSNRTVTLELIPLQPCSNCGQGSWARAPMIRERKSATVHLSIRGGEQKFSNSVVTDTNLDLLVPDSDMF